MPKLKPLNKKGFGHVEMIVFAVVILAIGCIGYFALRSSSAQSFDAYLKENKCNYLTGNLRATDKYHFNYKLSFSFNENIKKVVIDWSDGEPQTLNTNFALGVTHNYKAVGGHYVRINSYCTIPKKWAEDSHIIINNAAEFGPIKVGYK